MQNQEDARQCSEPATRSLFIGATERVNNPQAAGPSYI
jgi:hypothetical protein